MASIVKLTHAAIAERKDPKEEISKFLLNYRNTPHSTTGETPSKLMMNRIIRTKLPSLHQVPNTEEHQRVKQREEEAKMREDAKKRNDDLSAEERSKNGIYKVVGKRGKRRMI